MASTPRKTGLDMLGDIPPMAHLCQFYRTKEDIADLLVPYLKAGLDNNELCLWVTAEPLEAAEARSVLHRVIPNLDHYLATGQMQIISHTELPRRLLSGLVNGGPINGFDGIRVADQAAWLAREDRRTPENRKVDVDARTYPVLTLCIYPLEEFDTSGILDVIRNHEFTLIKQNGKWEVLGVTSHSPAIIRDVNLQGESRYQELFNNTLEAMEVIDAESGRILLANPAAARIFGFGSPDEMIGVDPLEYIPTEDREQVARMMAEYMFEKDLHQVLDLRVLTKDGRRIWVSAMGVRTEYKGKPAGLVSMRDITAQKDAERAFQESQEQLMAIFDGVRDGIALLDLEGRVILVNRRILEAGGYTEEEIVEKRFDALPMLNHSALPNMLAAESKIESGEEEVSLQLEARLKSGETIFLEVRVNPLRYGGTRVGSIAVLRDMTARKKSEEALRASEERNRLLVENAAEGIAVVQDGKLVFVNPGLLQMVGYSKEDILSQPFEEFIHPEDREMVADRYAKRLSGEPVPSTYPFRVIDRDGDTKWAEINSVMFNWEGRPAILALLSDITERKHTEEALQASEERFRKIYEKSPVGIVVYDSQGKITGMNKSALEIFGLAEAGESKSYLLLNEPLLPEEARQRLEAGKPVVWEGTFDFDKSKENKLYGNMTRSGLAHIHVTLTPMGSRSEGTSEGYLLQVQDITQRKNMENAFKENEKRYRLLAENISDVIWVVDTELRPVFFTPSISRLLGYTVDEAMSMMVEDILLPDSLKIAKEHLAMGLDKGEKGQCHPETLEFQIKRKDGSVIWVESTHSLVRNEDGSPTEVMGVMRDITKRKQAEELFKALSVSSPIGIYILSDWKLEFVNPELRNYLGYSDDELLGKDALDFVLDEDRESVKNSAVQMLKGERTSPYEYRIVTKSGEIRWVMETVTSIEYRGRRSTLGNLMDATQRKEAEQALRDSEERFRHLIETTSDLVWEVDENGRYTYVSPRIEQILGYRPEEIVGKTPFDFMPFKEANRVAKTFAQAITSKQPIRLLENINLHKQGNQVVLESSAVPFFDDKEVIRGYRGINRDITERRRAEEQIQQSFQKLEKTLDGVIMAITSMVETRDRYTAGHQRRVTRLACAIAQEIGLSEDQTQMIRMAGLLHDLGKLFIPTEILCKPGQLTEIEFAIIKTHPQAGYEILKNIEFPWPIAQMVAQHHERLDGSGYPLGLSGDEISLEARILAVSDVVEAMSSHRPYRPALGMDKALREIVSNKGTLYDPDVVEACVRLFVDRKFQLDDEKFP